MAFQDHRLFPHLEVRDNLTFAPDADDGERLEVVCGALGLGPLLERLPGDLSGGERARVSLGRALLSPAALLLLDEPLGGLDATLRGRAIGLLQLAMARWRKTILYVSHSPAEVAALTDHVIAMDRGRVVGEGPPMNVLTAGAVLALWRDEGFENSFTGRVEVGGIRAGREIWRAGREDLAAGTTVVVTVRASEIILARDRPEALSARNLFAARVTGVTGSAGLALVHLDVGGVPIVVEVTAAAAAELGIAGGARLWAIVKATSLQVGAVSP
jgi:molybdate transport system ATP-binding protein